MTDNEAGRPRAGLPARVLRSMPVLGVAALPVGALGTRYGLWSPEVGLGLFGVGVLVVFVSGVLGTISLLARGRRGERGGNAPEAAIVAAIIVGVLVFPFAEAGFRAPAIHQVTTDLENPPEFMRIRTLRAPDANPLALTPEVVASQRESYPWIRPLVVPIPPDEAYQTALQVIEEVMVLEVVYADPILRTIEATATTFWFGFKDDVAVRVSPARTGARVDVRSVSRFGGSDLGVNAGRVAEFFTRFLGESGLATEQETLP